MLIALHVVHILQYKVGLLHVKVLLYALKKSFIREQNFISKIGNNFFVTRKEILSRI